jgi:hypothetical protein
MKSDALEVGVWPNNIRANISSKTPASRALLSEEGKEKDLT